MIQTVLKSKSPTRRAMRMMRETERNKEREKVPRTMEDKAIRLEMHKAQTALQLAMRNETQTNHAARY